MFSLRDLMSAHIANRGECLELSRCPVYGCSLPTGCAVSFHCQVPTCGCSDESQCLVNASGRPFTELTEQLIQNTTDAVVLHQLHEELRQLSDAAGQRSQEIREFLAGGAPPGSGAPQD